MNLPDTLRRILKLERDELLPVVGSFLFALLLMASYSILRPVRDAMTSDWSSALVSTLWTGTFVFSFVAVGLYSTVAAYVRLRWLVPGVYAFFAASFVAFYLVYTFLPGSINSWVGYGYYMWVSVFALFHLSVFWSFMSQVYTREQAVRLFAMVGTGVSAGAILGGATTAFFVRHLGVANLILLAAGLLLLAIPLILRLNIEIGRTHRPDDAEHQLTDKTLDSSFYTGFLKLVTTPQLLGIAAFIFLLTAINGYGYFALKDILAELGLDRNARTTVWAGRDLAINTATFIIGIFLTNRLVKWLGMAKALAIVPLFVMLALLVIAGVPMLWTVVGFDFCRRVGNYAITRPSREMLFTQVDPAARFQTKPVIDIICYRGGDVFWAWVYTLVTEGLGASIGQAAFLWAVFALIWTATGLAIGRHYQRNAEDTHPDSAGSLT